jgi:tRNA threonylcarbamoyladenosine biosynthesis protein TsaE
VREPVLSAHLADEEATRRSGAALARAWRARPTALFVALVGELGAGKTSWVRGFLGALGVSGPVRSPTYALVETYPVAGGLEVHHFDWYRIAGAGEVEALGFREALRERSACLVEWPERSPLEHARADLEVALAAEGSGRSLQLRARSPLARALLADATRKPEAT